jgi:molybdenum cofactor biosynthesis enzyme MoaA
MRFIEFMPLDSGGDWTRERIVSAREIRETISEAFSAYFERKITRRGNRLAIFFR